MAHRGRGRGRGGRGFIEPPKEEEKAEISYMQPEIMPVQIMEDLLKQRGLSASILLKADRKVIIKYFYKHISPKYQRDYRENRRGKILKKMRQKRERKLDDEDWKKLIVNSKGRGTSSLSSSSGVGNSRDRLKPPPVSTPAKSFDEIIIKVHKPRSRNIETNKDGDKDMKRKIESSEDTNKVGDKDLKRKVESSEDTNKVGDKDLKRKVESSEDKTEDKNIKKIKTNDSSEKRPSDAATPDSGTPDSGTPDSGKKIKLKRSGISWP